MPSKFLQILYVQIRDFGIYNYKFWQKIRANASNINSSDNKAQKL